MKWGAGKDGLSTAISVSRLETHIGGEVQVTLWVRNSGIKSITFSKCGRADVGLAVTATDKDGKAHSADITPFDGWPVFIPLELPPGQVVKVKEFVLRFDAPGAGSPPAQVARFLLPAGAYQLTAKWSDTQSFAAREGEWRGALGSAGVDVKVAQSEAPAAAADAPAATADDTSQPNSEEAQSLFKTWLARARADGKIPGGMLGPLVRVMEKFVENNPTEEATPKFAEMLKRIDTLHDWTPAAAAAVALLDEVTGRFVGGACR